MYHILHLSSRASLVCNEFGKPRLAGAGPHFNFSHGGNYVALAVAEFPVGTDVECVGQCIPEAVPAYVLSQDELKWLERNPTPERFYWLWTRLESVLKADGRGFSMEHRTFSVLDHGNPWYIQTIFHESHIISCAAKTQFEQRLIDIPASDFLR